MRAHEIDVLPDGRFTLRLWLGPFHAFAVEFDGFTLAEESLDQRGRAAAGVFEPGSSPEVPRTRPI